MENLNSLRKLALYLLQKEELPQKCSLRGKMLKAPTDAGSLSQAPLRLGLNAFSLSLWQCPLVIYIHI
jgi:hypothetical protein